MLYERYRLFVGFTVCCQDYLPSVLLYYLYHASFFVLRFLFASYRNCHFFSFFAFDFTKLRLPAIDLHTIVLSFLSSFRKTRNIQSYLYLHRYIPKLALSPRGVIYESS